MSKALIEMLAQKKEDEHREFCGYFRNKLLSGIESVGYEPEALQRLYQVEAIQDKTRAAKRKAMEEIRISGSRPMSIRQAFEYVSFIGGYTLFRSKCRQLAAIGNIAMVRHNHRSEINLPQLIEAMKRKGWL